MEKIIEIKDKDWMKGLSVQKNLADGGLFAQLSSCDPFESEGQALGSRNAIQNTNGHSSNTIKFLTNFIIGGVGYVLGHSAGKLLKILSVAPYTVSDVSSSIAIGTRVMGATAWHNRYIYAYENGGTRQIRSWDGGSSDVLVLDGFGFANTDASFCVGADGNLYVGSAQGYFAQITAATTTSGNTNVFMQIGLDFTVRDIVSDGRYLVLLVDDNSVDPTTRVAGKYRCKAFFWDMVKTANSGAFIQADVAWDFPGESYIIGAKFEDGVITAFGHSGIWQFNAGTSPKRIRPFIGSSNLVITARPSSISHITQKDGSILWIDGAGTLSEGNILTVYAYGNPISGRQKIFYQPYSSPVASASSITAITSAANLVFTAMQNRLDVHNDPASIGRNGVIMQTVKTVLNKLHNFGYTKVVLDGPLIPGEGMIHSLLSQQTTIVSAQETKLYNSVKPQQSFIFKRYASGATNERFEEATVRIQSSTNSALQRVTVYATPIGDGDETL